MAGKGHRGVTDRGVQAVSAAAAMNTTEKVNMLFSIRPLVAGGRQGGGGGRGAGAATVREQIPLAGLLYMSHS